MANATPPTPSKRQRGCCSCLFILFVAVVAVLVLDEIGPTLWVKGKVSMSAPSIGATREQIEAWLDHQGIHHTRHAGIREHGGYPAAEAPSEFGGLAPGIDGSYIVGRIVVPHLYGWISEVWIYFFFDMDGRLIQQIVKRWDRYL